MSAVASRLWRWVWESAWAWWLGGSLAAVGYHFVTWQFWVVMLPTAILVMRENKS